ncbi:MAG: hypothetical protein HRU36_02970 [Rickettsiales bacterium]|nr:hypothetical protein [Rickettsiales bacterium]
MNTTSNILILNPRLAEIVGLNESIVLQQLYYWQSKYNQDKWIYNSYQDWKKQFSFWSIRTIRRIFASLEEQGFIKSKKAKYCKFYRLVFEKIKNFLSSQECPSSPVRVDKMDTLYTKTTTKTNHNNSLSLYPSLSSKRSTEKIEEEKKERTPKQKYVREQILEAQSTANSMIECWNKVFANSQSKIKAYSNKNLIFKLQDLYTTKFKHDLKKWESYAKKVASSKFLMGEKRESFKANFAWLLKHEVINSILNGGYGVGDKTVDISTNSDIQKMVEIWKSNIGLKNESFALTKFRIKKLREVLKSHFNSDIEEWKKFVEDMKESTFLNGANKNGFKACLSWIIKEETLLRAKEGEFHNEKEWNKVTERRHWEQKRIQAMDDLENNTEFDSRWKNTLLDLIEKVGVGGYISWFSKLKFDSHENKILALKASSDGLKSYVEERKELLFAVVTKYFENIKEIWILAPNETRQTREEQHHYKEQIDRFMKLEFPTWKKGLTLQQRRAICGCGNSDYVGDLMVKWHFREEVLIPRLQKEGIIA